MSDNFKYVQNQATTLAGSGAIIGATSIILTSFTGIDGTPLAMTDFGTKGFATINPDGESEEQIVFTGLTQNGNGTCTLTGVSNVSFTAPYTETSGLATTHTGGSIFIITNTSGYYNTFSNKLNDETISGLWNLPNNGNTPTLGTVYVAPTTDLQIPSKKYVDTVAVSGAPNAAPTVKGIVQEATTAQVNAGTNTGSTGAVLFASPADLTASIYGLQLPSSGQKSALASTTTPGASNKYISQSDLQKNAERFASSTTGNDTYVATFSPVISALINGMELFVKVDTVNTGAATLNPNALGATSIVRSDGSALADGDIPANGIMHLVYNSTGTAFRLQNLANAPKFNAGVATRAGNAASSSQTFAHGLGRTPRYIKINALKGISGGGSLLASSIGTYDGTSTNCAYSNSVGLSGTDTTNVVAIGDGTTIGGGATQVATATLDATNITLTWTYAATASSANINILWEAYA